ncbi:MAG: hypothetical protein OEY86_18390, partial [Nitrospira sp.]|nr:hypothetical protein [Nitrospira sp.]
RGLRGWGYLQGWGNLQGWGSEHQDCIHTQTIKPNSQPNLRIEFKMAHPRGWREPVLNLPGWW